MCAVTARVAGVQQIAVCAPPGPGGRAHPAILAACVLCEVSEVYRMGGAQAIAALAYGTQNVPAVDVIAGPGNAGPGATQSSRDGARARWRLRSAPDATLSVVSPSTPPAGRQPPVIQVFGLERDQATRAAIRFFKERRTPISFVDLRVRSIAPAELRRFVERLGAAALLDETSRAYRDAGLAYLRMDDDAIVARLLGDVRLLRLPLARRGNDVTAGRADATWIGWVKASDAS